MTTFHLSLAALLILLNASSLNSRAYQSSTQADPNQIERLGAPASIDPADSLPPGWQRTLDEKTRAQLDEMTTALQKYASDHNLSQPLPATLTLDDLVKAKYIREIPVAPAGKKFAISRTYMIVVLIDNK